MTHADQAGTDPERALVLTRLDELLAHDIGREEREFLGAQFDLGLAFVWFPSGSGGLGVRPELQRLVHERVAAAGGPVPKLGIGHGMAAPTIATCGSEPQRGRWLRPLFTGEEIWCQLFSEPGAGSDVANLATRAVPDGDDWVVNGHKVWTSLGHVARWGLLLTRTDPDAVKHRGLSYFVLDLHAPGVEVRPLRQMTGGAEFNEVFLTDVRIPDAHRIGDVGRGWDVALVTLMNERVSIGGSTPPRSGGMVRWVLDAWRTHGGGDPVRRDQVMRMWVEEEVLRLTNLRAAAARRAGTPGPEGSVGKLRMAELNKRITEVAMGLLGADALLHPAGYVGDRSMAEYDTAQEWFLRSRANSIEGGTSEVMRNILGERTLGLPGDVRVDKGVPWSSLPR
jgi:alkylation response protein AidB-like acyl-CoA dehydrogenase